MLLWNLHNFHFLATLSNSSEHAGFAGAAEAVTVALCSNLAALAY